MAIHAHIIYLYSQFSIFPCTGFFSNICCTVPILASLRSSQLRTREHVKQFCCSR